MDSESTVRAVLILMCFAFDTEGMIFRKSALRQDKSQWNMNSFDNHRMHCIAGLYCFQCDSTTRNGKDCNGTAESMVVECLEGQDHCFTTRLEYHDKFDRDTITGYKH